MCAWFLGWQNRETTERDAEWQEEGMGEGTNG